MVDFSKLLRAGNGKGVVWPAFISFCLSNINFSLWLDLGAGIFFSVRAPGILKMILPLSREVKMIKVCSTCPPEAIGKDLQVPVDYASGPRNTMFLGHLFQKAPLTVQNNWQEKQMQLRILLLQNEQTLGRAGFLWTSLNKNELMSHLAVSYSEIPPPPVQIVQHVGEQGSQAKGTEFWGQNELVKEQAP